MTKLIQLVRPSKFVLALCYRYQINPRFAQYPHLTENVIGVLNPVHRTDTKTRYVNSFFLMKIYYCMILKTAEVDKI